MSPAMADWSLLPQELLQLISEKLNSEIYLTRFRSVCSTWRSSIPKPHNLFPLNLPYFSDSNYSIIPQLDKHSIFLIKPLTAPNQRTLYRPWLARISPTSTIKFNLWHPLLFHPQPLTDFSLLDFNQLSIFDLGQIYVLGYLSYHRAVATFQGERIMDIVTHQYFRDIVKNKNTEQLVMLRCGDDAWSWTKIPNVASFTHEICIFKGRPCVTEGTGRTLMIGSDFSVHLVAEPVFFDNGSGTVYIMVENESELLLVHKYKDGGDDSDDAYDDDDDHELVRIDVFRLDQKEKKWLKLPNLGDMVLFLGQGYSFVASALDLGFDNGNFVIYCKKEFDAESEMSIFHLDQQRNSPLSDYPDYFNLVGPPPEWITSRCSFQTLEEET